MTSESDREHDLRQYERMLKALQHYRAGSLDLPRLISNLEALRDSLQSASQPWLDQFDSAWGVLEDVHAVMLDEGRPDFEDVDRTLVTEATARLEALVQSELQLRQH